MNVRIMSKKITTQSSLFMVVSTEVKNNLSFVLLFLFSDQFIGFFETISDYIENVPTNIGDVLLLMKLWGHKNKVFLCALIF